MTTMTKTMTLEKRVLERIKAQGVKPTPKGFFKARDTMLWFLVGVFLAALSIGTSMIIFMVRSADRGVYARLGLSFSQKLLYSIPLFWIAASSQTSTSARLWLMGSRECFIISGRFSLQGRFFCAELSPLLRIVRLPSV